MRQFTYFLYENFDAEQAANHPGNPRRILHAGADALLSRVADFPPLSCPAARMRREFGDGVKRLADAGALRERDGCLAYDAPVFLAEDLPALEAFASDAGGPLAERLWDCREALWNIAGEIRNGFDGKENLYHILCGMIFDGFFFDWLGNRGAAAVSRPHASGLDYLPVLYERCEGLERFSDGLLCSYNRLTDGETSLQSFGDGDGDRFDLYRCFRLRELGPLPERFREAGALLNRLPAGQERRCILEAARALLRGENCEGDGLAILELFGYAENGRLCVPAFSSADTPIIRRLAALVEERLYAAVERTLLEAGTHLDITPVRHGVSSLETANELYHILFGGINEEAVRRGLVAAPPSRPGEGRYLRCIEW